MKTRRRKRDTGTRNIIDGDSQPQVSLGLRKLLTREQDRVPDKLRILREKQLCKEAQAPLQCLESNSHSFSTVESDIERGLE